MIEWLKSINILEWIKLKPKYLICIGLTGLIIISLPETWRVYLGYDQIIAPHRGWFSITSLIFCVYGLLLILVELWSLIKDKWITNWQFYWRAPQKLQALSSDEKRYIAKYLKKDASSLDFSVSDGIVNSLQLKSVIYLGATRSKYGDVFPWNLQPWVLEAIQRKPLLKDEILKYAGRTDGD
jgi:hypothetical protein